MRLLHGILLFSPFFLWFSKADFDSRRERASDKDVTTCDQHISSTVSKNGTFTSPNYPEPYPPSANCEYIFTGQTGERVQIKFTYFDLHLPHEPPRDCEGVDAVVIFITSNGRKAVLNNFCGNNLPKQLMSNSPNMNVLFRSHHSSPEVKGFRAIYRFVTDFGITSEKKIQGTGCEFTFNSEDRSNGTFTSPNYPGYYPRDTVCNYIFKGKEKERVQLTFTNFEVDGVPPCKQDTSSDYVEFSNFKTTDRKLSLYCGYQKPKTMESDSDYFRITLKSDDKFDGTGFQAFYQFKKQEDPFTVKRISTTVNNSSSVGINLGMDTTLYYVVPAMIYITSYIKL